MEGSVCSCFQSLIPKMNEFHERTQFCWLLTTLHTVNGLTWIMKMRGFLIVLQSKTISHTNNTQYIPHWNLEFLPIIPAWTQWHFYWTWCIAHNTVIQFEHQLLHKSIRKCSKYVAKCHKRQQASFTIKKVYLCSCTHCADVWHK